MNKHKLSFFFIVFFLTASFVSAADDMSLEEIANTEAAKYYISKQFNKALEAFTQLESEHPQNGIIKRYIASLHDALRNFDAAVSKLKEALSINPDDMIARQLLAEIYIKQADFKNAESELQWMQSHDAEGAYGKYAASKLKTLQGVSQAVSGEEKIMPVQEFMKSQAAQLFAQGKFLEAFESFKMLQQNFPDDVMIQRFIGISLQRLDRLDESIKVFEEALKKESENVALRFYYGQSLMKKGKTEAARDQFRWVMENDETGYKLRAQQAMFQTLTRDAQKAAQKKWSLNVSQAYDFDTNAIYKSNDDNYTIAGDQNSGKYSTIVTGTYRFYQTKKWTFTADALYAQSIYNDFPYLNTYTPGVGISALYAFKLKGKPAFLNFREGVTETFLKNKYYVWSNNLSSSLIYIPHKKDRVTLTYRWGMNQYENDGIVPRITDRDGFSNTASISNQWNFNNANTFYVTTGYDFERHDTQGYNFIKNVHVGRLTLHFPIVWKVEGDLSYTIRDSNHIKYSSTPPKRRDDIHTFTATISRALNSFLTLSFVYVFEDSRAKNNAFEYTRNSIGVKLNSKF